MSTPTRTGATERPTWADWAMEWVWGGGLRWRADCVGPEQKKKKGCADEATTRGKPALKLLCGSVAVSSLLSTKKQSCAPLPSLALPPRGPLRPCQLVRGCVGEGRRGRQAPAAAVPLDECASTKRDAGGGWALVPVPCLSQHNWRDENDHNACIDWGERRSPTSPHPTTTAPPRSSVATTVAAAAAAALLALTPTPASAANVRLPPIDSDPARCERAFVGNTIGQANAVSDKLLDLRACKLVKADLSGKTLSGALLVDADLTGAVLRETVLTKAYAVGANFTGADATNAVVDRVSFDKANLTKVNFSNAILTG